MTFETQVKLAVYGAFAEDGRAPSAQAIAVALGVSYEDVVAAFGKLRAERVLFLEPDGRTIRMAPPFSGVPTQHRVRIEAVEYFANCGWDALGIPAALRRPGLVLSRCEQSLEPLTLEIGEAGPAPCPWVFHSLVRASRWWDDLVFT
ncbi:MAG TPA: organomercurial lyase [Candidatus Polarisedimenticolaceae bacterium]|nr:organomercurial lyase [Candidatus Polarisedimenticolaceae bacterium]